MSNEKGISEYRSALKDNCSLITEAIRENEMLRNKLLISGYSLPHPYLAFIPNDAIETEREIYRKYHILEILKDEAIQDNVVNSIQLTNYYSFCFRNFYIPNSFRAMLYKQDAINLVSIIEAFLVDARNNLHSFCAECEKYDTCKHAIKGKASYLKEAIDALKEAEFLDLTELETMRLKDFYNDRNLVHLCTKTVSTKELQEFTPNLRNEILMALYSITERLYKDVVCYYNTCKGYERK